MLLTVKVPPERSSIVRRPSRALSTISRIASASPAMLFWSASRTTGTTRPFGTATAIPMWTRFFSTTPWSDQRALSVGFSRSASTTALTKNGR